MNQDTHPDLRLLEVALEEQVGNLRPPDLRHRILAASANQRLAAATRVAEAAQGAPGSRRFWIAAAVLLLGIGVALGIHYLGARDGDPGDAPIQEPEKSKGGVFRPRSRAEFLENLGQVEAITLEVLTTREHSHRFTPGKSRPLEIRKAAEVGRILDLMARDLRPTRPAGWVWPNKIRLQMKHGGYMLASMSVRGEPRLGVAGIGDQAMGKALAEVLGPLIQQAEDHARSRQGVVFTRADLERTGPEAIPGDIGHLTCYALQDEDLAFLQRFPRVTRLDLRGCSKTIRGPGLGHVTKLRSLRHILLNDTRVGDRSLEKLAALPELSELNLSHATHVTGVAFAAFQATNTLQRLNLSHARKLDDEGIRAIAGVRSLEYLNLSGRSTGRVTAGGLLELQHCTSLVSLDLADSPLDMNQALAGFANLTRLQHLDLSGTNINADGFQAFHFIRSEDPIVVGAALEVLHLARCRGFDDKAMHALAGLKNLEELDLAGCEGFTDRGLQPVAGLTRLRRLNLRGCTGLTPKGVDELRRRRADCAVTR